MRSQRSRALLHRDIRVITQKYIDAPVSHGKLKERGHLGQLLRHTPEVLVPDVAGVLLALQELVRRLDDRLGPDDAAAVRLRGDDFAFDLPSNPFT